MDPRAEIDVDGAMRAFDALQKDGPRVVMNELRTLANETKFYAELNAPGSLATGWRVEPLADPDTSEVFGYAAAPNDKNRHGGKPVARWVDHGTGDQAGPKVKDNNALHSGQRPQRFVRKPSKRKQVDAIHRALLRVARRAGLTP